VNDPKRARDANEPSASSADAAVLRLMVIADLDAGMRLKAQAHWNQTEADWRRFLALQPDGCFVAEADKSVVGTVTTCVFGCVGWIGMLLVDETHRGQGIGRLLMEQAMCFLRGTGATRMRLDATEAGHPLHEKMGFRTQYKVVRFAGTPRVPDSLRAKVLPRAFRVADLPGLLSLDRTYTFVNRARLLARLVEESGIATRVVGEPNNLTGYLIERAGSEALQIGPAIAGSNRVGRALLVESFRRHMERPVYVDIPADHHEAVDIARRVGLAPQREFSRMCLGQPCHERIDGLWAGSGPEKG
jgi:GNAT superfamily N-acetyltransferase